MAEREGRGEEMPPEEEQELVEESGPRAGEEVEGGEEEAQVPSVSAEWKNGEVSLENLTKEEGEEGPIKAAARKCERIMEALEAVANKQMRTTLEERLSKAERELDQLIEFGAAQNGAKLATPRAKSAVKNPKARTTESVKSRFKGVYGVRSLKKGSVRWTAKLLKDNTWYRDGSYTDEEEAARAVDARLRAWGRDDECNFDDTGNERPARERKHGSSKRRAQPVIPPEQPAKRVVPVHHPLAPPMPLFPN
mmetsp:Transcript_9522/g.30449  ORF Transcript_9522/g.30449 Transcript_9522/m.30449 type:complete len:251 (+) Transcript_9522:72-824(+)